MHHRAMFIEIGCAGCLEAGAYLPAGKQPRGTGAKTGAGPNAKTAIGIDSPPAQQRN